MFEDTYNLLLLCCPSSWSTCSCDVELLVVSLCPLGDKLSRDPSLSTPGASGSAMLTTLTIVVINNVNITLTMVNSGSAIFTMLELSQR